MVDSINNPFGISAAKVAATVKEMSSLMGCDHKTAYDIYCHDLIKAVVPWDDVAALLRASTV